MIDIIKVTNTDRNIRIDKFLAQKLISKTRSEIVKMLNVGAITISSSKVKPSYKLKGDEIIKIGKYTTKSNKIAPNKNIVLDIIENNSNFVIINKQLGLQVHPSYKEREKTLVNALLARFPKIKNVGEDSERPGIVHRLDKNTTGLLVIAKNNETFNILKKQFQQRKIHKTYHTLVFGILDRKTGLIDAPIARATSYTKQKVAFGKYKGNAKEAQTEYKVLQEFTLSDALSFSLVKVKTKTGRTHQIRVHFSHIGHPLIGDQKYYTKNEKKLILNELKEYDLTTFYLHAKKLEFTLNNKNYKFNINYPQRFNTLLKYLETFIT